LSGGKKKLRIVALTSKDTANHATILLYPTPPIHVKICDKAKLPLRKIKRSVLNQIMVTDLHCLSLNSVLTFSNGLLTSPFGVLSGNPLTSSWQLEFISGRFLLTS